MLVCLCIQWYAFVLDVTCAIAWNESQSIWLYVLMMNTRCINTCLNVPFHAEVMVICICRWIYVSVYMYVWLHKYWCVIMWVFTYVPVWVGGTVYVCMSICALQLEKYVIFHVWVKIYKSTSLNEHEGVKLFINMYMWIDEYKCYIVCMCTHVSMMVHLS